jgi:hypothetical protein
VFIRFWLEQETSIGKKNKKGNVERNPNSNKIKKER